ncbi:MAG TPA: hypothetical protein ENJ17_03185 [Gammaproteobacteria bacterium]|nr:hypothetical protein [Gammaproteobacteria bacterium]
MAEDFKQWDARGEDGTPRYQRQSEIIKAALAQPGHGLDRLLELMRTNGEGALYLCGTRLDSDYAFGSGDLGTAISVLPEDGPKAAIPGYHPASTEIYIVFQGGLVIESLVEGVLQTTPLEQYEVCVIPPGRCHRVRHDRHRKAASFIVKTNTRQKPGVVRCEECAYYPRLDECPLYRRWLEESLQTGG